MSCCSPKNGQEIPGPSVQSPEHSVRAAALNPADHPEMAFIPSGDWQIGTDSPEAVPGDAEGPVRQVRRPAFLLDRTAVTNAQFASFVRATGYRTQAERLGWSFVFMAQLWPDAEEARAPDAQAPEWWLPTRGACWHRPDGGSSSLRGRGDHPVVHLSWEDAMAFCAFAGKRLPDETEWEIAARGGLTGARFPWGDELTPEGRHMCNIWQGHFPVHNTAEDGHLGTAPARSYPANGFGLFNMSGNVWEWTASDWSAGSPGLKAMRGGSYLCHASYCNRYRVSARTANIAQASSSHLGFRCAADVSGI